MNLSSSLQHIRRGLVRMLTLVFITAVCLLLSIATLSAWYDLYYLGESQLELRLNRHFYEQTSLNAAQSSRDHARDDEHDHGRGALISSYMLPTVDAMEKRFGAGRDLSNHSATRDLYHRVLEHYLGEWKQRYENIIGRGAGTTIPDDNSIHSKKEKGEKVRREVEGNEKYDENTMELAAFGASVIRHRVRIYSRSRDNHPSSVVVPAFISETFISPALQLLFPSNSTSTTHTHFFEWLSNDVLLRLRDAFVHGNPLSRGVDGLGNIVTCLLSHESYLCPSFRSLQRRKRTQYLLDVKGKLKEEKNDHQKDHHNKMEMGDISSHESGQNGMIRNDDVNDETFEVSRLILQSAMTTNAKYDRMYKSSSAAEAPSTSAPQTELEQMAPKKSSDDTTGDGISGGEL